MYFVCMFKIMNVGAVVVKVKDKTNFNYNTTIHKFDDINKQAFAWAFEKLTKILLFSLSYLKLLLKLTHFSVVISSNLSFLFKFTCLLTTITLLLYRKYPLLDNIFCRCLIWLVINANHLTKFLIEL